MEVLNSVPSEAVVHSLVDRRDLRLPADRLRHSNPDLVDGAINAISNAIVQRRGRRGPLGSPSVPDLLACFKDDFASRLIDMTFEPEYILSGDTRNARGIGSAISDRNSSVDRDTAETLASAACDVRNDVFHQSHMLRGDSVFGDLLDSADGIKRHCLGLMSEGWNANMEWQRDTTWSDSFDEIVLKPLMVRILKGETTFDGYWEFWGDVLGTPSNLSEDDRILFDLGPDLGPSLAERFLHIRTLSSNLPSREQGEFLRTHREALVRLVHTEPKICMAITSFSDLIDHLSTNNSSTD